MKANHASYPDAQSRPSEVPAGEIRRRLHTPATAETHYVTEFHVAPSDGTLADAYVALTQRLAAWSKRKWKNAPGFLQREETYGPNSICPEAWALHVQHLQTDQAAAHGRSWFVDVALKRETNERYRVHVAVSHALDPWYMGWQPPPPDASVPGFMLEWLVDPRLKIRAGGLPMAAIAPDTQKQPRGRVHAIMVTPADVKKLNRIIFDEDRSLPLVFINGDVNPVTFPLQPDELQRRLLGCCYVLWAPPAAGWGHAWDELPAGYVCPINSVRVYQPAASPKLQADSYRHRFFGEDEIRRNGGPDAFVAMIRDGFTRRMLVPRLGRITNCDDVLTLRADEDFRSNRSRLHTKEEEIALYESEYARLQEQKKVSDQLLAETDAEKERLALEIASLRPRVEGLVQELEDAKNEAATIITARDQSELMRRLAFGHATVADYLNAVISTHAGEVEALPSAIKSAQAMNGFEFVGQFRDLLVLLVTKYRDQLVAGNQEAWRVFGRHSFASKESENLSKEGRTARTFKVNGHQVFMEQHLKIGVKDSEARCLRLHFHWDPAGKKLIIGHCGKHLPL